MLRLRELIGRRNKDMHAPAAQSVVRPPLAGSPGLGADVSDVVAEGERHFTAGRYIDALSLINDALSVRPSSHQLLFACGSILFAWGRFHEALKRYEAASEAGFVDFDLDMQLGWSCFNLQRYEEAELHFRRAVRLAPESETASVALANLLETCGSLEREGGDFARLLSKWPENYHALMLLGACRFHMGDREGGLTAFRQATVLDPSRSQGWSNLGAALGQHGRYAEGLEALRRAFELDKASGESGSVINYATALREEGHFHQALSVIEDDLARNPDPRSLWLRSIFLLESGRLTEGWIEHEFRWMREPLVSLRWNLRCPVWAGQDIAGKVILVHAEQGAGDSVQFIRYARFLKERGAKVLFEVVNGFDEVWHDFDHVDEVIRTPELPPFDYHVPLLSLPRVLGTTASSIPVHAPYLKIRPQYRERWSGLIKGTDKLKVGLVWAGNPKHVRDRMRSIPLAKLGHLAGVGGVQLYSLQKGAAAGEISSYPEIVDLGRDFESFCDTAAAIDLLDLVITVDTSVAHLAGALAKPVWLMLPKPCDWRWLLDGDRTAWYPTMRLFRQSDRDRWEPVIEDVHEALRECVRTRDPGNATREGGERPPVTEVRLPGEHREASESPAYWGDSIGSIRVDETRYGIIQYPSRDKIIADSLRYYGEHLYAQAHLMGRFIRPGAWVLESDAGFSMWTLFLSESVGTAGHVIAYEPDPLLSQIARQNLWANHVRNVTWLTRYLGVSPNVQRSGQPARANLECGTDTIDGLRLGQLDWIRINDGSRCREVLNSGHAALWRFRPWIFVNVASDEEFDDAGAVARDHGYHIRRVTTPLFNPENYNRREDDIFGGRVAFALLAIPEEISVDIQIEASWRPHLD